MWSGMFEEDSTIGNVWIDTAGGANVLESRLKNYVSVAFAHMVINFYRRMWSSKTYKLSKLKSKWYFAINAYFAGAYLKSKDL